MIGAISKTFGLTYLGLETRDAPPEDTEAIMATSDAPIQIGRVVLTVNDLSRVGDFYQDVIGLNHLRGDNAELILGAGDLPLLELRQDRNARHHPREAGLFHTAFLLPDRRVLGSWLRGVAEKGQPLDGASDHLVSEAIYLHDPEGNGIEVYADRPRDTWRHNGSEVQMDTIALDLQGLMASGRESWRGMPEGGVIGHVHLQVGDVAQAEDFYMNDLGMDRMAHVFGASFFASGGYHHHLAGNIWNSRGAGTRSPDSTGLSEVVLSVDAGALKRPVVTGLTDPWGTAFRIEARA